MNEVKNVARHADAEVLVSKLDVKEVAKFDFPRLKRQEVEGPDEQSAEKVTERMIALAKVSITRKSPE